MDEFLFVCLNGLKEFSVFGKRLLQRSAGVVFESGMRWMKPGLPAGGSELLVAETGVGGNWCGRSGVAVAFSQCSSRGSEPKELRASRVCRRLYS